MRLRHLRAARNLSQRDVEKRAGLASSYTSLVENGRVVPSIRTLEKYARALDVPIYAFFCENSDEATLRAAKRDIDSRDAPGLRRELWRFIKYLSRMSERDRSLLLFLAHFLAGQHTNKPDPAITPTCVGKE